MKNTSISLQSIRVWDLPVRVFHWLMVLSFAGAYITSESERWRLVHVTLGYTLGGLLVFRLLWGFIGTRYARFGSFVRGPQAVLRYVQSVLRGQPEHHTGHNPAGAVAIVLMMVLGLVQLVTGWATYNEVGGEWLAELHEGAANAMVLIIGVHLLGVVSASWMHKENLARAMVTGRKMGVPNEAVRSTWWPLGVLMVVVVLGFWWLQSR
jgi:cytochrome b